MNDKTKKIIATILASVSGVSGMAIASAVTVYDAMFKRYERPDYSLVPGMYSYDKYDNLPLLKYTFKSNKANLQGYYYPAEEDLGLVVICHGIHAGADDYLPIIEYLHQNGYSVFAFDYTGTYDSQGESMVGMCQSIIDTDYALRFIKQEDSISKKHLFLLGHSWGGYASSSVLSIHKDVEALIAIAPMNNGFSMIVEKGKEYAGSIAAVPQPVLSTYQRILFKQYTEYQGYTGINSTNIPVLIAQGIDDKIITYDNLSITAYKDKITNPNVVYYDGKGVQGDHCNIWHSKESALYQMEVESEIKLLEFKKGEKLTDDELREFYKTIDHRLYSEVNYDLMNRALSIFNYVVNE